MLYKIGGFCCRGVRNRNSILLSVVTNGPHSVTFFPEKTNDAKTLTIGPWVKDMLLLMDRGFFKYGVFARIIGYGMEVRLLPD